MEEISNVGYVRTAYNPADAFTKVDKCTALENILTTGSCDLPIEQWVIRAKPETPSHVTVSQLDNRGL